MLEIQKSMNCRLRENSCTFANMRQYAFACTTACISHTSFSFCDVLQHDKFELLISSRQAFSL